MRKIAFLDGVSLYLEYNSVKEVWSLHTSQSTKINVKNYEKQSRLFPLRIEIVPIKVRPKIKILLLL